MKTKELLQQQRRELQNKLSPSNMDEVLPLLKANEKALQEISKIELLRNMNGKYSRLREYARRAYECEQPTEDVSCADGTFHKTRIKKYPKLAALQYARANWEDGRITVLNINGERFNMFKIHYEYNKPNVYTRPATFQAFLELNTIPLAEITMKEFEEMSAKLNALNEKLEKDIEAYKRGCDSLETSSFQYWGLVGQSNSNLYKYTPNK